MVGAEDVDALPVTLNCPVAVVDADADALASPSGTLTPTDVVVVDAAVDASASRILTTDTFASDAVPDEMVCRSALSNTCFPYNPVPYENLSDCLRTNCSATDDVDAVELTRAPDRRFLLALDVVVAEAEIAALSSRNRVTEHDVTADADAEADASFVVPSTP